MNVENVSAKEGFQRLVDGNARFASGVRSLASLVSHSHERRSDLVGGQAPFAIILGCSDSRAPAEVIFDQGLGDLFVIRVAGNIVAPSQVGSVEFAAERFGTRLVVVMGHSHCGAIAATIAAIRDPREPASRNMLSIVDRIRPAIASVFDAGVGEHGAINQLATRANVRASAHHLRTGSPSLEQLQLNHGLVVVGAEYDIETGLVDFFDGAP